MGSDDYIQDNIRKAKENYDCAEGANAKYTFLHILKDVK